MNLSEQHTMITRWLDVTRINYEDHYQACVKVHASKSNPAPFCHDTWIHVDEVHNVIVFEFKKVAMLPSSPIHRRVAVMSLAMAADSFTPSAVTVDEHYHVNATIPVTLPGPTHLHYLRKTANDLIDEVRAIVRNALETGSMSAVYQNRADRAEHDPDEG